METQITDKESLGDTCKMSIGRGCKLFRSALYFISRELGKSKNESVRVQDRKWREKTKRTVSARKDVPVAKGSRRQESEGRGLTQRNGKRRNGKGRDEKEKIITRLKSIKYLDQ